MHVQSLFRQRFTTNRRDVETRVKNVKGPVWLGPKSAWTGLWFIRQSSRSRQRGYDKINRAGVTMNRIGVNGSTTRPTIRKRTCFFEMVSMIVFDITCQFLTEKQRTSNQ